MPINSEHPEFTDNKAQWAQCSDFNEGARAVKAKGTTYLPQPGGMNTSEYNAFRRRASFFNGMGRTVTGLVGAMTRVPADVTLPSLIDELIEDATGDGKSIQELIKQVLNRVMTTGRIGILVDRDQAPNSPLRLVPYNEDRIVNWRVEGTLLTMLVLRETTLVVDDKDPYESEFEDQYREIVLNQEDLVQVRVWKKQQSGKFEAGPWITPLSSRGALNRIPFVFFSPYGTETSVSKAPLADLCEINLSHYLNSADLEHGRHLTSLPTPWATGVDPEEYKKTGLKIGSGRAWLLDSAEARVGMLEFTGKGLGHLSEAILEKQQQMAVLGAKLLQAQRKQVESAELARMANSGDESILVGISNSVGTGFKLVLELAAEWEGASPGAVSIIMNNDFIDTKLDPDEIKALLDLYLNNVIDMEEFVAQLKTGERLHGDPKEVAARAIAQAQRAQSQGVENGAGTGREVRNT